MSSEQNGTPSTGGNGSSESPDRRDPRDMTEGRDFADFLMGSGPLPAESAVPLPGEQDALLKQPADTDGVQDPRLLPDVAEVTGGDADGNGVPDHQEEIRDRAEVIGTSMRWFAGWCLRFLVIAAAGYILWIGSAKLWAGILPIILSIIVCTVLWPLSRQLRKWHFPNALAVLTSLLVFFGVFAGIIAAIAPSVADQAGELVDKGTEGVEKIQDWVAGPPLELQSDQIDNAIDQATNWLQDSTDQITQTAVAGVSAVTSAIVTLVVVLVLTFFFLKDGEKFLPMVRRVTGRRVGWHITEALTRCWNTLGGFIRTQAIVSFIDAFFIGLGLFILGVPLAGPLAIITFFAGFIPIVGAFTAGALSVLVALVGNDFTTALIVLLIVTVGGGLWGIIGAFLAVPVAAMIAEILRYIGDLTDLSTGEKRAEEINFATEDGAKGAERNEDAARRWREWRLTRRRVTVTDATDTPDDTAK